jgi:hypothetical protein
MFDGALERGRRIPGNAFVRLKELAKHLPTKAFITKPGFSELQNDVAIVDLGH